MAISVTHDHVGFSVLPADLDNTIDWYAKAFGFAVERRFESHGMVFAFLVSGDAKIELMAVATTRPAPAADVFDSMDPARLHHLCLAVDDLDAAVAELADQGVGLIGGPMDIAEIGQRIAFVPDNLGNIIELAQPGTRS